MSDTHVTIGGMSCGHCVGAVSKALEALDLQRLDVSVGRASFASEGAPSREQLAELLDELGFDLLSYGDAEPPGD